MMYSYYYSVINKLLLLKKRNLVFFLLCILQYSVFAQFPSTIGEIFNYEAGDEFHKHGIIPSTEPNAQRIKIIDKFYSNSEDTVFYIASYSNYHSIWLEYPQPHLEYSFDNYIDTLFYTHLDSSILSYVILDQQIDTTDTLIKLSYSLETNTNLCESYTDKISVFKGFGGFGDTYTYFFSKGLGLTQTDFWYEGSGNYIYALFYFKKAEYSCGTSDLTGIDPYRGFNYKNILNIYPNPASEYIEIKGIEINRNDKISIYLSSGKLIASPTFTNNKINISHLKNGIYYIKLIRDKQLYFGRFIVF